MHIIVFTNARPQFGFTRKAFVSIVSTHNKFSNKEVHKKTGMSVQNALFKLTTLITVQIKFSKKIGNHETNAIPRKQYNT